MNQYHNTEQSVAKGLTKAVLEQVQHFIFF